MAPSLIVAVVVCVSVMGKLSMRSSAASLATASTAGAWRTQMTLGELLWLANGMGARASSTRRRAGRAVLSRASALCRVSQRQDCAGRRAIFRLMILDVFRAYTHAYEAGQ